MRRGNRDDVVVRPKTKARKRAPAKPKGPTVAELAARVTWLEECQQLNLHVVANRLDEAELSMATIKANMRALKARVAAAAIARTSAALADAAMSAINLAAKQTPPVPVPSQRLTRHGKIALAIIVTPILMIGISLLLAWLT